MSQLHKLVPVPGDAIMPLVFYRNAFWWYLFISFLNTSVKAKVFNWLKKLIKTWIFFFFLGLAKFGNYNYPSIHLVFFYEADIVLWNVAFTSAEND